MKGANPAHKRSFRKIMRIPTVLALIFILFISALLDPVSAAADSTAPADRVTGTELAMGQALLENGIIEIPEEYKTPAEHQGRVEPLAYSVGKKTKKALVYVPYGYSEEQQYNILYLLHGAWGNEKSFWGSDPEGSLLKNTLDHLIENEEMQPILVVTPTYYTKKNILPIFDRSEKDVKAFPQELVSNLMPVVETAYSTYASTVDEAGFEASREHRAFGGFSMGSVTTWYVFENNLAFFRNFIPCSGDSWTIEKFGGQSKPEETARALADSVTRQGYTSEDFFIYAATGTKDMAEPQMSAQIEAMKNMDVFQLLGTDRPEGNTVYCLKEGAIHYYTPVIMYLFNILPDLWP